MTIGTVRPSVLALSPYRPGKAASQAEAEHGITNAIKLASNENPFPTPDAVVRAATEAITGANRYADHRASELRARIAAWIDVDPATVTVGCGSVGLLQQIALTYVDPGDEVVYPWLSFEAYPLFTSLMAGTSVQVPLVDHTFDLDAVAAAVTERTKLVLLANPNNPTGTAVSTEAIGRLVDAIADDVIVVVDEAYREFIDPALGDPVADLVPHHRNVIVTRTFSKAYAMAGMRVGYAVTDPEIIAQIDKVLLAFAVNGPAQAAAMAAIDSADDNQARVDAILAERDRVVKELTDAGWSLPDAQANFVYLPTGDRTDAVHLHLERSGVVTRPFPGHGIRVTIGTPSENDRFITALADAADRS